ncbi:spore coat associated protein CotJA [Ruminococcus gauvreauii]|uniref:Spore coat associated protein CotJA n=2 Tax=Ruminococcus gauvreauii TaxID=438033 RepID=A0ABY5VL89_9FIRM|nr:spore coat associated protein CotJA [Ruminococcus gauvreauii]UWP61335.1 spore coat associated protein CotJA [Ruminococcus gauvreauii]
MAFVASQKFKTTFEPCKGLKMGTIFPELCKPFCGKRGGCR